MVFNNSIKIAWITKKDKNEGWALFHLPITFSNSSYAILTWALYGGTNNTCVPQIADNSVRTRTSSSLWIAQDAGTQPLSNIQIVFLGY